ncbi:hypothetical protein [Burkholderia ubonensis]|uniref:hypothetical protein n=1 Tax=Burkholderia ubonensis TaxID=101571 RepID=UPI000A5CBE2B|nr:hypothetical protein [Burkholderia ubonensis]
MFELESVALLQDEPAAQPAFPRGCDDRMLQPTIPDRIGGHRDTSAHCARPARPAAAI